MSLCSISTSHNGRAISEELTRECLDNPLELLESHIIDVKIFAQFTNTQDLQFPNFLHEESVI